MSGYVFLPEEVDQLGKIMTEAVNEIASEDTQVPILKAVTGRLEVEIARLEAGLPPK